MEENNDSVANAVGKGPALILTLDNKDYILAPLQMKDLAEVEIEAKRRRRSNVLDTIKQAGDLLTSEQKLEMIRELSTESHSWIDFLTTPSGTEYVLTKRLRKSYPELSEEEAQAIITIDAINRLQIDITELVGLDAFIGEKGDDDIPPESG